MDSNYIIFYTEDDTDDQKTFTEILDLIGNSSKVYTQETAAELLDTLHTSDIKPDVIFLDLHLPGLNGFQTLQILKGGADTKMIPVVLLTTSDQKDNMEKAKELGATMFVTKPRRYEDFIDVMKLLLAINWRRIPPNTKTFVLNFNDKN